MIVNWSVCKSLRMAGSYLALVLMFSAAHASLCQQTDSDVMKVDLSQKLAAGQSTAFRHAMPMRSGGTKAKSIPDVRLSGHPGSNPHIGGGGPNQNTISFPGDVTYQGGPTVYSAVSHPVYLMPTTSACTIASCWGAPETFLADYTKSQFQTVMNQYVGATGTGRYSLGKRTKLSYTPPTVPLTDLDMQYIVHAVASSTGNTGYGHIYHLFLPPGQDECFDNTYTQCYSPDNSASFVFCAYHGSVDFTDIGHVLYTVEPFQNIGGCAVEPGTPNGQLVDSTNDVLSHELSETISDPDGTAWWNTQNGALNGSEVGDECFFLTFNFPPSVFSVPFVYTMSDALFATQPEYSNQVHGCAVRSFP